MEATEPSRRMRGYAFLASAVAVCLFVSDPVEGSNGRHQLAPQFEGHVGCQFSNLICGEDEECIDDGLFGNCQKIMLPKDMHKYKLSNEQLLQLEGILQFLIESGYTWHHRFTQCVLVNSLIAYRYHYKANLEFCILLGTPSVEQLPQLSEEAYPLDFRKHGKSRGKLWKKVDSFRSLGQDEDTDNRLRNHDYRKRLILENSNSENHRRHQHSAEVDQHVEGLDEFFNKLSPDELENLKQFLADGDMRNYEQGNGHRGPVKKSPMMVTNVRVNYIPGNSIGTENKTSEVKPEFSDKAAATAEQMTSDEESEQDSHLPLSSEQSEKALQVEYSGQQQAVISQNPLLPMQHFLMSGLGSQFGLTTIVPGGAQGKDIQHVRYEPIEAPRMATGGRTRQYLITMYFLCGVVGVIIIAALIIYVMRRHAHLKGKISKWTKTKGVDDSTSEYQDLCRQHMQAKLTEKVEPVHKSSRVEMITSQEQTGRTTSTGSSTSSWTEEPVTSNMDISTGHIILSYMEDHLTNKDRLQKEWDSLCAYDAEPCSIVAAIEPTNMRKNRYTDILPYEHSRVKLDPACNVSGSDYINACSITDHDPRNPAYIAAQGPLPHTVADFWQMVWEQGCVVIINLTRLTENTISVCHRYWPEEGSDLYHIYEVHLISEHAWCDDYVVRSFFLKNLQTNETRTITQFHFLTWPNLGVPSSTKVLLDFRRKVNKSYRGRACPIIVHCSDGAGRTGTYCLVDMALNRLHKGAKEIDIAATLEHIRDQRVNMVRTKEQFEFALAAVAEEVHAIVHVPQNP